MEYYGIIILKFNNKICWIRYNLGSISKGGVIDDVPYNSDGDPNLLSANRDGDGRWLNAYYDKPDNRWNRNNGFAFVASQLSQFLSLLKGRVLF